MRLLKYLLTISCLTVTALVYVHQQVELVKLSYVITYKEKKIKDILDHKEGLRYNIDNLEDPSRLERVLLAKKIEISFPKRNHVYKIAETRLRRVKNEDSLRASGLEPKGGIYTILEFFGLRAEAHAKEK